ncbi:ABC transporter substrate-binding protein [Saccharothrix violaceirubra]|uniref:Alpha-glucoside transport system substrate-binding protein n=1 Tax=Saccharothrix violaceirubra TaxID=413306 RepID=A0A7W7WWS8_9PSEU|nr:ABC transporter substrate-binding protein [Saccharothrix violaceirubra]MBB4966665.1 alpha-glucoside transport system substrate-binding protein [Saccharothrix violaceirubra]
MRNLVLVVLLVLSGCTAPGSTATVTILASWSGAEEAKFRRVLDAFEEQTGIEVDYIGTRALGQVLESEVQQGDPPDLVIFPSPGELATYAKRGYLHPLDDVLPGHREEYGDQWLELERAATDRQYGLAVKADLKGVIWFNPKELIEPKPARGAELQALVRRTRVTPWCVGMGASPYSGWPGTDWVETLLLRLSGPALYQDWTAGRLTWASSPVRAAWETWGALAGPDLVRGGARGALLTDFGDAGRGLFTDPPGCLLELQGTFAAGGYQGYETKPKAGIDYDFFEVPPFGEGRPAKAVAADLAAMFNDTPQARRLMAFLASASASAIWPGSGGAYSVNRRVPPAAYPDDVAKRVSGKLTEPGTFCFDASDLMPPTMRTAFHRAVLEYLADPGRLDEILANLDEVRAGVPPGEWLDFPCGS